MISEVTPGISVRLLILRISSLLWVFIWSSSRPNYMQGPNLKILHLTSYNQTELSQGLLGEWLSTCLKFKNWKCIFSKTCTAQDPNHFFGHGIIVSKISFSSFYVNAEDNWVEKEDKLRHGSLQHSGDMTYLGTFFRAKFKIVLSVTHLFSLKLMIVSLCLWPEPFQRKQYYLPHKYFYR